MIPPEPNFLLAHAGLGYAYAQKSAPEAALAEFQKAIDITGRALPAYTAAIHLGLDERDQASWQ